MNLFVDDYGARLEVEDFMLKVMQGEVIRKVSFLKLTSINLLKPASISTSVLLEAANYQVPVLMYGPTGKVEAWVWSPKYGNIAEVRKQQVYFIEDERSHSWVNNLILLKFRHQSQNLKWLADRIPGKKVELLKALSRLDYLGKKIEDKTTFESLRGIEGSASRWYWGSISLALQKHVQFSGRDKRQPKDQFNKCLNYMYGILYGIVESSLLMVGLDPYIGIYHIIRHDRPTLAYDHIEPFRPWVDNSLMHIFLERGINEDCFEEESGLINSTTRKMLVERFFKDMDLKSILNNRKIKRIDHIHYLSQLLVKNVRGIDEDENYML